MADETQRRDELGKKFDFLADKIVVQRERRMWVEVPAERFREVFEYVVQQMGFSFLCTITGLDDKDTLAVLYHVAHKNGTVLNMRTRVPRDQPVLVSITDMFPAAANYERELVDLLGFEVQGLPPGNRYPLPEGWPTDQHPLRKDWKPAADVAAATGAPPAATDT